MNVNISNAPETKLVRIKLSALTRVEYSEVIEVPIDMSDDELQDLADRRYDEVDGGDFYSDPDYWEKGSVDFDPAGANDTATFILDDGDVVRVSGTADAGAVESCAAENGEDVASATTLPIVVVELSGGMVQRIQTSAPAEVLVLDSDVEGSASESVEIQGSQVLLSKWPTGNPDSHQVNHCKNVSAEVAKVLSEATKALDDANANDLMDLMFGAPKALNPQH